MSVEHMKEKQIIIDEIRGKLDKAASAVLIDYMGITVAEADAMRKKLREADIDYKIYKNTLVGRAVEGTDYAELSQVLAGPSALAVSYDDATAPARIISGVMKEYKKMSFKAGIVEGVFYDAEGMKDIADVPSREELLAKFLGSIQSPIGKFVRTLAAIADEKPADGAAPAAAPAEAVAEAPAEEAAAEAPVEEAATEAPAEEAAAEAPVEEAATEAPAEEAATEAPAEEVAEATTEE